jgi:two-component system, sensor histidine kinase and response regulator
VDAGLPQRVQGDPLRLRQVLSNLLSNAIKFTPAGEVELLATVVGEGIRFAVRDTGIGLSPEQLTRIFEPFTQADESTTRRFGGTGLGLTISAELVAMMGGRISVESEPGAGACFFFTVALPAVPVPDAPSRPAPPVGSLAGRRVLLVEDLPVNQLVARKFLERAGLVVEVAANGMEAVELACHPGAAWDIILMDVHMPVMDGLEAARSIVGCLGTRAPPVVAMTAYALPEELERCRQAGMVECITKPLDAQLLSQTLGRLLGLTRP